MNFAFEGVSFSLNCVLEGYLCFVVVADASVDCVLVPWGAGCVVDRFNF